MENSDLNNIIIDIKSGKKSKRVVIDKLLQIGQTSREEGIRLQVVDNLLEWYRGVGSSDAEELNAIRDFMEEKIGERFLLKYTIVPSEAMALGLIEIIMRVKLEDDDEVPNPHHVHAVFKIRDGHVIDLDIVEMSLSRLKFLDLFPKLKYLTLCMAGLEEIDNLGSLRELEWLDLAANDLTDLNGLENLSKLKKLYIHNNHLTHVNGLGSLIDLEELLIHQNSIKRLKGVKKLKNFKHIEVFETLLSEKKKRKIKKIIKRNLSR